MAHDRVTAVERRERTERVQGVPEPAELLAPLLEQDTRRMAEPLVKMAAVERARPYRRKRRAAVEPRLQLMESRAASVQVARLREREALAQRDEAVGQRVDARARVDQARGEPVDPLRAIAKPLFDQPD